jgi:predicted NBD/HSP70 family sugar kinase
MARADSHKVPVRPLWSARKVVPEDARRHNRSLVLRSLFHAGPQSRADLARWTGLTRVTISDVVSELLADGLVEEAGRRAPNGAGKPGTLLAIVSRARALLCVDLSGHERFQAAVVDLAGTVLHREVAERRGRTGDEALELVVGLVDDVLALAPAPVLGVGVGSPGVVDAEGVVREAPNLGWRDLPLAALVAERARLPVHVANDANAAVLAEYAFGSAAAPSLLLVRIGQGVGAGVLIDGHLVVGDGFAAGEIGHVVVHDRGEPCACGRRGCLERSVAVPLLRERVADQDAAGTRRVLRAAGRSLGIALAPVIGALNLREVVLSGPNDLLDGPFREAALDALASRTMPAVGGNVELRMSALGEDGVVLGAATLVLNRELGVT